jgi:aminoglycoside phosphotransferase family enzyme
VAIADPQTMHANRLALLNTIPLPPQNLKYTTNEPQRTYHIHDLKCSENAWLVFNTHEVVKILRPYDDCRYLLKERRNRHKCLLEGLEWNRKFTEDIHLGLARYCDLNLSNQTITLGKILANPKLNDLDPDVEYVLVMNKLPKQYRLDMLLKNEHQDILREKHKNTLIQFMGHIHASSGFSPAKSDDNKLWGSIDQLQEKLKLNLKSVEEPDISNKAILQSPEYQSLLSTCKLLKKRLLPIFTNNEFQNYFTQRVEKQQIKRCHGDLKSRNIWIMHASGNSNSKAWKAVRALDAIDFNADFCNIDTLSDFAMLVADIYARENLYARRNSDALRKSSDFVYSMIEDYLDLTKQQDKASRFVLNYYLIEKAFVGALVSILYDNLSALGWEYLEVTIKYLRELQFRQTDK